MYRAAAALLIVWLASSSASADIAVVVEHQWTIDNNFFSCFAYDPNNVEFVTGGYGSNQSVRWSTILDEEVEPWLMDGDVLLNWFQLALYARDGAASYSGSLSFWGMARNPLDGTIFVGGIGILRETSLGDRLPQEPDLSVLYPDKPNSYLSKPTYVEISNVGGIYRLTDTSTDPNGLPRAAFLSSGVIPGDRIMLFPVDLFAQVLSGTYTVTDVISETEIRLDRDPCWYPNSTADELGYVMSVQPHLTLGTFRATIPYYDEDHGRGPKAHYAGGFSPDGLTYYIADIISDNVLAVDTQVKESFSVYIPKQAMYDFVVDEIAAGRYDYLQPEFIFDDNLNGGWEDGLGGATVDLAVLEPNFVGGASIGVTYTGSGQAADFVSTITDPAAFLQADDFESLEFMIHGGTSGGQQIAVRAYDAFGANGTAVAVDAPAAGEWSFVSVPVSVFGLTTLGGIRFENTTGGPQSQYYLDEVRIAYRELTVAEAAALVEGDPGYLEPNNAAPSASQVATNSDGRVFFSLDPLDDIVWTDDGVTLNTFLTSDEVIAAGVALDKTPANINGLQVLGMTVDRMGTVYWGDNRSRGIWKAPRCGGAENIRRLASREELVEALFLPSSPRGLNNFMCRGTELLTYNFVDGNFIYKVDMETYDYGDFDEDVDCDADDLGMFASVMAGPDETTAPVGQETLFEWADLDLDGDADMGDFAKMQCYATSALPPLE